MEIPMELNKETALRLWKAQFGKESKAYDFAGRQIAKAAYNDRNSKFGWNVDHICPQSKGGKTADHNLICCHILTNDEKADKFPCFVSNGMRFEIQKRQNHYEILAKDSSVPSVSRKEEFNFFDAAQGMKLWKKCKRRSGEKYMGYVKIRAVLSENDDLFFSQFCNFIKELFGTAQIFVSSHDNGWFGFTGRERTFTVIIPDLPAVQDAGSLLDDCIVLNTYSELFREKYNCSIEILCGMKCLESWAGIPKKVMEDIINLRSGLQAHLAIDELIRLNTSAAKKIPQNTWNSFYPYEVVFAKLDKDLQKYM